MSSTQSRPPKAPPVQIEEPIKRKIYFLRILFAVIAGVASGLIPVPYNQSLGFIIGLLLYVASQVSARRLYAPDVESPAIMNVGFFSYLFVWIIFWSLTITLLQWSVVSSL